MIRLLRKCAGIRKLAVCHRNYGNIVLLQEDYSCKSLRCPCDSPDNHIAEDIVMDCLEEVEIENNRRREDDTLELVNLLCKCSMIFEKKVSIIISKVSGSEYLCEKIRSIHPPSNKVVIIIQP